MSKKRTGILIAVGAALGAAAAGISYYLKYKSFTDEIDKDFHDYEEDEIIESAKAEPVSCTDAKRTYISLDSGKCKSCDEAAADEETTQTDVIKPEEDAAELTKEPVKEAPIAATVEDDTEGAN